MRTWEDLADAAIDLFGGHTPHPDTAAVIQAAHQRHPEAVERALDRVAAEYQDGNARSPWGLLKHRVSQIRTPATDTAAKSINDRDKAIARAEQWLRNAGLHLDREAEIVDELFGDRGRLRDHHTPDLEQRLLELWHELRPHGEQAEHDQEQRLARYAEQRAHLDRKPAAQPGNTHTATVVQDTPA